MFHLEKEFIEKYKKIDIHFEKEKALAKFYKDNKSNEVSQSFIKEMLLYFPEDYSLLGKYYGEVRTCHSPSIQEDSINNMYYIENKKHGIYQSWDETLLEVIKLKPENLKYFNLSLEAFLSISETEEGLLNLIKYTPKHFGMYTTTDLRGVTENKRMDKQTFELLLKHNKVAIFNTRVLDGIREDNKMKIFEKHGLKLLDEEFYASASKSHVQEILSISEKSLIKHLPKVLQLEGFSYIYKEHVKNYFKFQDPEKINPKEGLTVVLLMFQMISKGILRKKEFDIFKFFLAARLNRKNVDETFDLIEEIYYETLAINRRQIVKNYVDKNRINNKIPEISLAKFKSFFNAYENWFRPVILASSQNPVTIEISKESSFPTYKKELKNTSKFVDTLNNSYYMKLHHSFINDLDGKHDDWCVKRIQDLIDQDIFLGTEYIGNILRISLEKSPKLTETCIEEGIEKFLLLAVPNMESEFFIQTFDIVRENVQPKIDKRKEMLKKLRRDKQRFLEIQGSLLISEEFDDLLEEYEDLEIKMETLKKEIDKY